MQKSAKQKQRRAPGQLDVLGGYKVRADIDEHYLNRIFTGLNGEFTFNDSSIK
jgi:HlyD family secretion protein